MGLNDSIEQDEAKLKELLEEEEGKAKQDVEETTDEDSGEEGAGEDKTEDQLTGEDEGDDEEEGTKEEDSDEEEKVLSKDDASFAKIRRENRILKAKLASMEKPVEQPVKEQPAKEEKKGEDPEPSKDDNYEEWLEWSNRQLKSEINEIKEWKQGKEVEDTRTTKIKAAVQVYKTYEDNFKKEAADYDAVVGHVYNRVASSIATLNPGLSDDDLHAQAELQMLRYASGFASESLDPAEEMYNLGKEWGYKPAAKPSEGEGEGGSNKKINLGKIEKNKKKTASPLQTGGQSGNMELNLEKVASMTNAEFSRLTPAELDELEAMAAGGQ